MTQGATEDRHEAAAGMQSAAPVDVLDRLLAAQLASVQALRDCLPALAAVATAAAEVLRGGGRLIYCGAGSAGLMALADGLELAGTFGIPPERTPILIAGGAASLLHLRGAAEDDPEEGRRDLAQLAPGPGDLLLCVSASGGTPYTVAAAKAARAAGARVAALANVAGSPLLAHADLPVAIETGAEVVSGSTRMAAGTAQKLALNMISTLAGLHLGHIHEGYMVNLQADNAKLRDRAARIVAALAAVEAGPARAALDRAGGAVKPAVLIAAGATPETAAALLARSDGHLGPALAGLRG